MKLRGTIRSTKSWTNEGSGLTASEARAVAISGMPDGYELVDVTTVSAKPGEPVTMRAIARSGDVRDVEADGVTQTEAAAALRAAVPEGFLLLQQVAVDDA
ncbi:hypothetical protein OSC27_08755 [Microbacterium sp. STN6]|uniref:hypothetical protein n=1 Tax=Microbacterium sp. STN6 TaxID=2995588 RepID=UPI002260A931|nr:hypothetical protein [Microbacterium sp. STN6]MCX7522365.1 hypothetical protein [Microbacterium sp. STN6]